MNYIFIIISFIAVYKSVLNSSNSIIKSILFISWFALTILILNEQFEILHLQEVYTYLSASILCVTHFYNLKIVDVTMMIVVATKNFRILTSH